MSTPLNAPNVTLSGKAGVGETMTASPAAGVYFSAGQWLKRANTPPYTTTPIANATGLTYVQAAGDVGYSLGFVPTNPVDVAWGPVIPYPAPVVTTAPVLAAANVGSPVTWSAGVATGSVSSSYSLINQSGAEVASASGTYTPTVVGQLTIVFKAVGPDGQVTTAMGNTVTVGTLQPKWLVASTNNRQPRAAAYTVAYNAANTGGNGLLSRYPVRIGSGNPKRLRVSFLNTIFSPAESLIPNNVYIDEMSLERVSTQTSTPVLWGGQRTTVLTANTAGEFVSDDILPSAFGLTEFPRGDDYFIKIKGHVANVGDKYPASRYRQEGGIDTGQDRCRVYDPASTVVSSVDTYGAFTAVSGRAPQYDPNNFGICPIIIGEFADGNGSKTLGFIGDSIFESADYVNFGLARQVLVYGAAANALAGIDFSMSGQAQSVYAQTPSYFQQLLKYCSVIVDELGTNNSNTTDDTPFFTYWDRARSAGVKKIFKTRLTPRTAIETGNTGSNQAVSSLTRAGTTATAVVSGKLPQVGQAVLISGATPAGYNSASTVVTSVNSAGSSFTYTMAADPGASATGTIIWSDLWTTEENQANTNYPGGGTLNAMNQRMLGYVSAGRLDGVFPFAAWRGTSDEWKWKASIPSLTIEGLHPSLAVGTPAMLPEFRANLDAVSLA